MIVTDTLRKEIEKAAGHEINKQWREMPIILNFR